MLKRHNFINNDTSFLQLPYRNRHSNEEQAEMVEEISGTIFILRVQVLSKISSELDIRLDNNVFSSAPLYFIFTTVQSLPTFLVGSSCIGIMIFGQIRN